MSYVLHSILFFHLFFFFFFNDTATTEIYTLSLHDALPIIGFPRGAGLLYERYITETGVDGIGLDTMVPAGYARERLQPLATVQGNLDPILLITGGSFLETGVRDLRRLLGDGPFVFNLGHGVLPETPPENVEALAQLLAEPIS